MSTHAVCLHDIHVAVGVIVHLLVDIADRFEADDGILVLAQRFVNTAQVWRGKRSMSDVSEAIDQSRMSIVSNYIKKRTCWSNTTIEFVFY